MRPAEQGLRANERGTRTGFRPSRWAACVEARGDDFDGNAEATVFEFDRLHCGIRDVESRWIVLQPG